MAGPELTISVTWAPAASSVLTAGSVLITLPAGIVSLASVRGVVERLSCWRVSRAWASATDRVATSGTRTFARPRLRRIRTVLPRVALTAPSGSCAMTFPAGMVSLVAASS